MKTVIQRAVFPKEKRLLVLSDPHAHREGFLSVLSKAHFSKDDILVIVGDILEKGPESLGLVREIMRLLKTHTVYPLMGNVDHWRLNGILSDDPQTQRELLSTSIDYHKWWHSGFLYEMLSALGIPMTADLNTQTVFPRLRAVFEQELSFLSACPAILETENRIFVHGGIPHENLDEFISEDRHRFLKWDRFLASDVHFRKTVVVGHWPVALYSSSCPCANPIFDEGRNVLSIDGGCGVKKDGQINLLIFPSCPENSFSLLTWDGLPTVTALDSQDKTDDFGYIRWGDNKVEVIETGADFCKVIHRGKTLVLPRKALHEKDGSFFADDFTDYRLSVSSGDTLSVIEETPFGLYAKKDGVTGWYTGRYIPSP